jgi:ATP-dependent DNA helicase RecG
MEQGLEVPIEEVKGVGVRRGAALREAGILSVRDLLYHLPRRYLDRSRIAPIAHLPLGREATLIGRVRQGRWIPGSRSRFLLVVEDDSGELDCVWFQGGRYLQRSFAEGDLLALSGKVDRFQGRAQMVHPEYEFVAEAGGQDLLHTGGIVPLYTSSADLKERGLRSRGFRRIVRAALEQFARDLPDPLPAETRARLELPGLSDSLWRVHFPPDPDTAAAARRRLAFEELYELQLGLVRRRQERLARADGIAFGPSRRLVPGLLAGLPFALTGAQQRTIGEIAADMAQPWAMNRLLQGDVGSGKTLVAVAAMLGAVEEGYQTALMAPTEILAEQHYHKVQSLAARLGVRAVLLVGGQRSRARRDGLVRLASGEAGIAVGTHALIQEQVDFPRLGLAVIDEQHRFGVAQRSLLSAKGRQPDVLVMTATPIPRSLALSVYGDLDVSVLDELPPGRKPVLTALRPVARRDRVLAFAAEQMHAGRQVYLVYPLVAESENTDLGSACAGYEELRQGLWQELQVGLLHGRLPAEEKAATMQRFTQGQIQALVCTTVIEVGVDVPNATVMIVEHAERFGLAQLHQLRGRVGRGAEQSYCVLMAYGDAEESAPALERLQALCATQDGFEIAQRDLELRGPGELLGTRQAGLPPFAVADLARDGQLLLLARQEAQRVAGEGA